MGRADPLVHEESVARDRGRQTFRGIRNDLLHGWNNVPMPFLPVRLLKATVYQGLLSARGRHFGMLLRASLEAHRLGLRALRTRRPVSRSAYLVDHAIRKRGPLTLDAVEHRLTSLTA